MVVSSRTELIAALARGDATAILGTPESEWLDFKRAPYVLVQEDQKLELAKDVAGLANSRGGLLVIGIGTRREEATASDLADSVTPVRQHLVNVDSYRQIIENLTYPPLRDLQFSWWAEDNGVGILTIEVPAASDMQRPVLVVRARDKGSKSDLLLGIFERTGDRVSRTLPAQIHAQLQLGRLLQLGFVPGQFAPAGPPDQARAQRLEADRRDANLAGRPHYWLQAWPDSDVIIQNMGAPGTQGAAAILANPPQLREHGFGLRVGSATPVTPIPGGGLRAFIEGHSISLLPNGLLTWVVDAGSEWLTWGEEKRGVRHSINPIALAEGTLEFCRIFINLVLPRCEPRANRWRLSGGMKHLRSDGEPARLASVGRGTWIGNADWVDIPHDEIELGPLAFADAPPGAAAGAVLCELYAHLGIGEPGIPFVRGGVVSEEEIANIK